MHQHRLALTCPDQIPHACDPDTEEGWRFFRNFDGFMVNCDLDHDSRPYEERLLKR